MAARRVGGHRVQGPLRFPLSSIDAVADGRASCVVRRTPQTAQMAKFMDSYVMVPLSFSPLK